MSVAAEAGAGVRQLLEPGRIALVGASADPLSLSGRYLHHLRRHGYEGEIVPVNPRREEIDGIPCFPSVAAAPDPIDTALVLVDGAKVEGVVAECVDAGVPGVVVFSSGFGEAGPEGVARQRRIEELLREGGGRTRLIGPNSPGFVNYNARTAAAASAYLQQADLIPGDVAVVSQSGAIGGIVASRALDLRLGLSHVVFTGNEADVTVVDCMHALVDDERVGCLVVVIEAMRDLIGFRRAAERAAAAGKTLVALRIGRSEVGRRTAQAHTGALANDDAAIEAVLARAGAVDVADVDELLDVLDARRAFPAGSSGRIGVLCTSGGLASIGADATSGTPLSLPPLSERAAGELASLIPDFGSTLNPTDLTGMIVQQPELIEHCLVALEDEAFDAIVVVLTVHPEPLSLRLAEHVVKARSAVRTPVLVAWETGSISFAGIERLRAEGIPTYTSLPACMRALARLAAPAAEAAPAREAAPAAEPEAAPAGETIPELRALELLAPHGIEGPAGGLATSGEAALELAERAGYPVVAKLQSPQLPHRSKLGGVRLGLDGPERLGAAFAELQALAARLGIEPEGISVVRQAAAGTDVFVGARRTEAGWLVVLAPGGSDVESSTQLWRSLTPLEPEALEGALRRLLPAAGGDERRAMAEAVGRVEAALEELPPEAIVLELNPLRLSAEGALALDALIELAPDDQAES